MVEDVVGPEEDGAGIVRMEVVGVEVIGGDTVGW
eukprot:CAMPEP_0194348084 /NCGR_PEP_ID=MMETSP0171-20130528/106343_1 /TAXON_ID=218684 /ORGANISM="Corethron pennatum, Strain L29A3" /LENGTH=33 /DNA_ID= /DNA_START= /DNA_END= /DNA_ORIENTATION=